MISAFLAIAIVGSVVGMGYGALAISAASMSDAPSMIEDATTQGIWTGGVSLVVFVACVGIAVWRAV